MALAAEIADGWNVIFFSPAMSDFYAAALAEGFARPGARQSPETFDVVGGPLAIIEDDDLERAADQLRPTLALYIGGMGARGVNFHHEVFVRMGYEAEARKIQDLYLAGDKKSRHRGRPHKAGRRRGADRPVGQDRRRDPALEADRPHHVLRAVRPRPARQDRGPDPLTSARCCGLAPPHGSGAVPR